MRIKKSLEQRIKEDNPEFMESVQTLSKEEIDQRLADLAKNLDEVVEAKEQDEALSKARQEAKDLNTPYMEAQKAIKLKSKYLILLLKTRG